jgi:hypothetical protein
MEKFFSTSLRHIKSGLITLLAPLAVVYFCRHVFLLAGIAYAVYSAALLVKGSGGQVGIDCSADGASMLMSWVAPKRFWTDQKTHFERILIQPFVLPSMAIRLQDAELSATLQQVGAEQRALLKDLQPIRNGASAADLGRIRQLRDEADRLENEVTLRQYDALALAADENERGYARRCLARANAEIAN